MSRARSKTTSIGASIRVSSRNFVMPACIGGRRARSHPVRGGRAGWTPRSKGVAGARIRGADRRRTAAARRRPRPGCGPAPWRSAGPASSVRPAQAMTRWAAIGRRTKSGRRPVARATRRTASPSGIASGPRTAIVESASRVSPSAAACRIRATSSTATGRTGSFAQPDQPEDRERVEGVAQVIEHVVAAPVDDAGLEDRVGQARATNELLGCPLRAVVGRRPVRAGAQEAQHHDPRDAGRPSRLDDRGRATDVDRLVRLVTELSIDARAVDDRLATHGTRRPVRPCRSSPARTRSGATRPRSRGPRPKPGVEMRARRSRSRR